MHSYQVISKLLICLALVIVFLFTNTLLAADQTAQVEFFETHIRPVLVRHCYECHSAATDEPEGGLRLDWREPLLAGGDSGPAITPGNAEESLLVDALRHETIEMPPEHQLDEKVIADFVHWINTGAHDPRLTAPDPSTVGDLAWEAQLAERKQWWSLLPVSNPPIPSVENTSWSDQPLDQFILAALEQQQLAPTTQADAASRLRRATLALTGLPPTLEEQQDFLRNSSPQAWQQLIDRLLASPHFGERFARHWMDVVRYTDTYGYEWDIPAKGAWRYRDYLVRAFNDDLPFDQLVREHIAGDLLPAARINEEQQINESLIGLMFYQMGEKRHGDSADFNGVHQEMLDDKINTFSKAFQAITINCARCHNHKLDAVSQREYYALAGVFMNSRWVTNTLDTPERNQAVIAQLKNIKDQLRSELAKLWLADIEQLTAEQLTALADNQEEAKKLTLSDLNYPWQKLTTTPENLTQQWTDLAAQYAEEQQKRSAHNAENFTVIVDFRDGVPPGWDVDGIGFSQVTERGDFVVALDGPQAVRQVLPGGLFTYALSPRLNGALRTPLLTQFDQTFLTYEYSGGEFSASRTIFENGFLTERQTYLDAPSLSWLRMSTRPDYRAHRVYQEIATKTSNPNFPPRMGLSKPDVVAEQINDPVSWFGVSRVLLHNNDTEPLDDLERFAGLFTSPSPTTPTELAAKYVQWFRQAVQSWADNSSTDVDIQILNQLLQHELLTNSNDAKQHPAIQQLVDEYRQVEKQLLTPQTTNGMADIDPGYNYRLNIRGVYEQLGDEIPRGYLQVLTGSNQGFETDGCGRLELAQIVASPENPLTARVFVNRVWHWLFGQGIVNTPNNFGKLGGQPSHPELLDYLTSQFLEQNWSLKKLVRTIMLSQTWQQASLAEETAIAKDPANRLLHHYPARRLEAETVRDSILAASGQLDLTLYGPPIDPPRANEDPQKRLVSGPLDGNRRRSIYTKITIMEPPQFLATFNQPQPKIPTGKRDVSNTPLQSLSLLNDAFVNQQATRWAEAMIATNHADVPIRLEQMFRQGFARPPTTEEVSRWQDATLEVASLHEVAESEILANLAVWKDIAHAIFNTKEFIYVR